jgi:curved DNA-binding protein CbpA
MSAAASDRAAALMVLGLPADASDETIRAAYRRMSTQW